MDSDIDFEPISEIEEGTKVIGTKISDYWLRGPYHVIHNGQNVGVFSEEYRAALSLAVIVDSYEDLKLNTEKDVVPIKVALDGRTAIATYLHGVQRLSRGDIAEIMDITKGTVREYLRRFRSLD
jgi:hypothetical protein